MTQSPKSFAHILAAIALLGGAMLLEGCDPSADKTQPSTTASETPPPAVPVPVHSASP